MATVKFNDVSEFVEEITRDAGAVERKVIRITFRHRMVDPVPMREMSVVATAVVAGHVVELVDRCGTFFSETDEAERSKTAAKNKYDLIRAAAEKLGLEVRAGVFEE
jgi:hypothetical protein